MFRNNKINMVIAIVVAIILWMYVVGQVNPSTTKKFSEVPITFVGEDKLNENGLAVAETETASVSVTLQGNRADLMKMSGSDISVSVDLSNLGKGKNAVPVKVTPPRGTELDKISAETINVKVEDRVVESKEVKIIFEGNFPVGSEPGQIDTSPRSIEVSGAKSAIDRVAYVQGTVPADKEKNGRIETDVGGIPVDGAGNRVDHVHMSQEKIHVSATVMEKKTVVLKTDTVGEVAQGHRLDSIEVAQKITIKGPKDVIKGMDEVHAEPLSIAGLTKTTKIPLRIILPQGVEIADESKGLQAVVAIKDMGTAQLQFSAGDIKVTNQQDGMKVKLKDGEFSAVVKGKNGDSQSLSMQDVGPFVDVKGLEAGTHKIKIMAAPSADVERVVFSPDVVEVTISEV